MGEGLWPYTAKLTGAVPGTPFASLPFSTSILAVSSTQSTQQVLVDHLCAKPKHLCLDSLTSFLFEGSQVLALFTTEQSAPWSIQPSGGDTQVTGHQDKGPGWVFCQKPPLPHSAPDVQVQVSLRFSSMSLKKKKRTFSDPLKNDGGSTLKSS